MNRKTIIFFLFLITIFFSCNNINIYNMNRVHIKLKDVNPLYYEVIEKYKNGKKIQKIQMTHKQLLADIYFAKGDSLFFDVDGSLYSIQSAYQTTVYGQDKIIFAQGLACWANTFDQIGFFPNGQLRYCYLATRAEINNHIAEKISLVHFSKEGKVTTITFRKKIEFEGFKPDPRIYWDAEGKIRTDYNIHYDDFPKYSYKIKKYKSGKYPKKIVLRTKLKVKHLYLEKGTVVEFYGNGALKRIRGVKKKIEVFGVSCHPKKGGGLYFYLNSELKKCYLGEISRIQGWELCIGQLVKFNTTGEVIW